MATSTEAANRARIADFITNANNEYARLSQIVHKGLEARDAGKPYNEVAVTSAVAQMAMLTNTLAFFTGTDYTIQGIRLERQAQARRDEVFPHTTFLAPRPPI